MNDFVLVGKQSRALSFLANTLRPKLVIVERKPYSQKFWRRKLLSLDLISIVVNAWLGWRFNNHPSLPKMMENPNVMTVDRVTSKMIKGQRVCLFGSSIVGAKVIAAAKEIVNLHLGLLPYYKGCKPEVWSMADRLWPGVTLHRVTTEIDGGRVLVQKKVQPAHTITDTKISLLSSGSWAISNWFYGYHDKHVPYDQAGRYYSTPSWRTVLRAKRFAMSMSK